MSENVKSIAAVMPVQLEIVFPLTGPTQPISARYVGRSGAGQSTSTTSNTPPYRRTPGWWKFVDALSMVMGRS